MRTLLNMCKCMYAFLACAFKINDCMLSWHVYLMKIATRVHAHSNKTKRLNAFWADSIKQSGCTLFRHNRSELNSRTLSRRLAVCQPFQLGKIQKKCWRRSFSSSKRVASVLFCKNLRNSGAFIFIKVWSNAIRSC